MFNKNDIKSRNIRTMRGPAVLDIKILTSKTTSGMQRGQNCFLLNDFNISWIMIPMIPFIRDNYQNDIAVKFQKVLTNVIFIT